MPSVNECNIKFQQQNRERFYLEMVLLLTDKSVVRIAEVESFVGVHPVMRYRQLLEIMIAEGMPRGLLERVEPNALVTGVDVAAVGDLVVVQHRAAAAATVLDSAQLGFLEKETKLPMRIATDRPTDHDPPWSRERNAKTPA